MYVTKSWLSGEYFQKTEFKKKHIDVYFIYTYYSYMRIYMKAIYSSCCLPYDDKQDRSDNTGLFPSVLWNSIL